MSSRSGEKRDALQGSVYLWLFGAIVLLHCLWVLSLPLFPSHDGPVHLYLVNIFQGLLANSGNTYSQYYRIGHYFPPYSFHYYLLDGLMHFVSPLLAEKIFICFIFILFAFGLRYLLTGIGENGILFSFFGLCLLLNWSLSMGFESYLFSLSLGFWALGLWSRAKCKPAIGNRRAFIVLLGIMSLSHSVPVAAVLAFAGLDLVVHLLSAQKLEAHNRSVPNYRLRDIATLALSSLYLLYMAAFTQKRRYSGSLRQSIHPLAEMRSFYGHLEGVRFFNGTDWPTLLYKGSMYTLLLAAAAVALTRFSKSAESLSTWRVAFVLIMMLIPVMPVDINGGYVFAARLVILGWVAAFAAASGTARLAPRPAQALLVFAVVTSAGTLWLAHREVNREAYQIAEVTASPVNQHGKLGLILPGLENPIPPANDYGVNTYVWAGAHSFREGSNVLMNTPWMDVPILPVNSRPALGIDDFEPTAIEFFYELRSRIENGDQQALALLSRADFLLFSTGGQPVDRKAVQKILQTEPLSRWSCHSSTSWTETCEKQSPLAGVNHAER